MAAAAVPTSSRIVRSSLLVMLSIFMFVSVSAYVLHTSDIEIGFKIVKSCEG